MRVTLINLWPRGGMLHYSIHLANALSNEGVEVTMILPHEADTSHVCSDIRCVHIEVPRVFTAKEMIRLPIHLMSPWKIMSAVRSSLPDVVHVNSSHVSLIPVLSQIARDYPIVTTLHDVRPHLGRDNSLRKRLERHVQLKNAIRVFVHGEKLKKEFVTLHPEWRPENIVPIHHGAYRFSDVQAVDVLQEQSTFVLFGRIETYKGIRYFIEAANIVADTHPEAKFIIAGQGDLSPYAAMLVNSTRIEIINHFLSDDEMVALVARASCVVLPYIEASQSGVIALAYAYGRAVITTDVGALAEVVDESVTGLVVPPANADALASAMSSFLEHPNQMRQMGDAARIKAETELNWKTVARTTLAAYKSLLVQRCFSRC